VKAHERGTVLSLQRVALLLTLEKDGFYSPTEINSVCYLRRLGGL
jgi:hypothetical protein